MKNILNEYENSEFYSKYKNTYFSDCIMKDIIIKDMRKHSIVASKNEDKYKFIYETMVTVINDFIKGYAEESKCIDDLLKWRMLYSMYIDPDSYSVREHGGIECTADGLLSIRRIYNKFGLSFELVEEYKKYRRTPIFHFPSEKGGINTSRAKIFGDRIDHTLFDLKMYCNPEMRQSCRLISAYNQPKTFAWIESFDYDFKKIVEWFGIKGVFVDDNYEVFDLEYNDGEPIKKLAEKYKWDWSDNYYNNLKIKIEEYELKARKER